VSSVPMNGARDEGLRQASGRLSRKLIDTRKCFLAQQVLEQPVIVAGSRSPGGRG